LGSTTSSERLHPTIIFNQSTKFTYIKKKQDCIDEVTWVKTAVMKENKNKNIHRYNTSILEKLWFLK
jgi:hypothetical protein